MTVDYSKIKTENLTEFFERVKNIKTLAHLDLIKIIPAGILACPFCDDAFESLEFLARHMIINHYYETLNLIFELVKPENIDSLDTHDSRPQEASP